MKRSRPSLKIPRTLPELLLDGVSIGLLALVIAATIREWPLIPDSIPIHFGFTEKPDYWGGKAFLILPVSLALISYLSFSLLRKIPHRLNYPWPITPENAERQYRIALSAIAWLKTELVALFSYLGWMTIETAQRRAEGMSPFILAAILALLAITSAWFFIQSYRSR